MPSEAIQFLSVDEAIEIHERLVVRFGGSPGIRDRGMLESALFRPQTGYYRDLVEMAAALFESLITNHSFVDGNKRMAFFCTDVFLRMNGWKLRVEAEPANAFIVGSLESGSCNFERLVPWIRQHMVKLQP